MDRGSLLLLAALAGALPAQAPRLVDSMAAPLAYLALEALAPAVGAPANAARDVGPVQRLLADPSLDVLFGGAAAATDGGSHPMAMVRGLLARSSGELEIALTSIAFDGGKPRLLLRARLQPDSVQRLQGSLQDGSLATRGRQLGNHQVYALRDARGPDAVEIAMVGSDLLVGNDGSALQELLQPAVGTSAAPSEALARNAQYAALRKQSQGGPGSLQIYADWRRLGARLQPHFTGAGGELLRMSGLGEARAVFATVAPGASGAFAASLLLDYEPLPPATEAPRTGPRRPGGPLHEREGRERGPHREPHGFGGEGVGSWFAAIRPQPARALLGELPAGGVGGMVLALDLEAMAQRTHAGSHLLRDVEIAFTNQELEYERCVTARLAGVGALRIYAAPAGGLRAIYALRGKSRKAAADLFDDLRRATVACGPGRVLGGDARDKKSPEVLELRDRSGHASVCVGVVDDHVVLAADAETLAAALDDVRIADKARGRRDQAIGSAMQALGRDRVAGLFDVDLASVFEQLVSALPVGATLDLSQLPRRHIGCLELRSDDSGALLRCSVLSSR